MSSSLSSLSWPSLDMSSCSCMITLASASRSCSEHDSTFSGFGGVTRGDADANCMAGSGCGGDTKGEFDARSGCNLATSGESDASTLAGKSTTAAAADDDAIFRTTCK